MKRAITLTALLIGALLIMGGCSQDETKIQGKDQSTSKVDDQISAPNKIGLSTAFIKVGNALDGKPSR